MSVREFPLSSLVSYPTKGKLPSFVIPNSKACYLYNCRAFNNHSTNQNIGLLSLLANPEWKLWRFTNVGPAYADITSTLQGGSPVAIFSGTINDGYIVQGSRQMGMIGLNISTNQTGGVFTYEYWNGSAWATLTTLEVPADYNSPGDNWIVFQPPQAWVIGGPPQIDSNKWSIRIRSTTAPAGAVSIGFLWTAQFLEFYEQIVPNAVIQITFPDTKPFVMSSGQGGGLIPYFSVPDAANQVAAYFSITG